MRMARARQRSCFCPWERLLPPEEIGWDRERNGLLFSLVDVASTTVLLSVLEPGSSELAVVSSSGTGVLSADGIRWTRCKTSLSW